MHSLFLAIDASITEVNQRSIDSTVETVSRIYARAYFRPRAADACARAHAILHQHHDENISTKQIYGIRCIASVRGTGRRCVLYMAHSAIYSIMDYIIQENAWSSSDSTSQRMKQATLKKVFLEDESKSIYIVTEFHTSDELLPGPEIFIITS